MSTTETHELRVILVGRTGLDAALRLDPEVELVRVKTPLEAVGELATPLDPQSLARPVVVLAPEVEWALRQPSNGDGHESIQDFVRGLRIAHPSVVLMGVSKTGVPGAARGAELDGTIAADLPSDLLRLAIRQQPYEAPEPEPVQPEPLPQAPKPEPAQSKAPQPEPAPSDPPKPPPQAKAPEPAPQPRFQAPPTPKLDDRPRDLAAPKAAPTLPTTDDVGDLSLVALLLKGQEVLARALELIRVRTGDDSIEFVASGGPAPLESDLPVAWEGTVLGHLRATTAERAVLAIHARWLAGWLRTRDQQAQLRAAAFTDSLTGAYNRRYFDRFLAAAIDQAREARRHVSVFIFDIDDFKVYNDRYGHEAGDNILRETVALMRSVIRPTDRVCRIGGDEFAVIFNEPSGPREPGSRHPADVALLAHRFQQQLQQHRFPKLSNCLPGTLTVSGGLATYPWDGTNPEQLLIRADQNSLQSKRQGKNAITFGPVE